MATVPKSIYSGAIKAYVLVNNQSTRWNLKSLQRHRKKGRHFEDGLWRMKRI